MKWCGEIYSSNLFAETTKTINFNRKPNSKIGEVRLIYDRWIRCMNGERTFCNGSMAVCLQFTSIIKQAHTLNWQIALMNTAIKFCTILIPAAISLTPLGRRFAKFYSFRFWVFYCWIYFRIENKRRFGGHQSEIPFDICSSLASVRCPASFSPFFFVQPAGHWQRTQT